ncbi:unnamed protein product [Ixodes hexagonus]
MSTPMSKEALVAARAEPQRQAIFTIVIVCVVVGTLCLALLMLAVNIAPSKQLWTTSNLTYCCPDIASELTKSANFTLDPCTNFYNYTCYNFHHLSAPAGDVVDPVANMAVLGIQLSYSFWDIIFREKDWNPTSRARINQSVSCYPDAPNGTMAWAWATLRMGVSSAGRAAKTMVPGWNVGLHAWSTQILSPAQIFYMRSLFLFCGDSVTVRASTLYPSLWDFRNTYTCPSPDKLWIKKCAIYN